jgi:hypothetical protein
VWVFRFSAIDFAPFQRYNNTQEGRPGDAGSADLLQVYSLRNCRSFAWGRLFLFRYFNNSKDNNG